MSDRSILKNVYRASICVWVAGVIICLLFKSTYAAAGWSLGAALSMGSLKSLEWAVTRFFVPGAEDARRNLARLSIVKMAALIGVLSIIVIAGGHSFAMIAALCAGVLLTQAVIFVKAVWTVISIKKIFTHRFGL